MSFLLPSFCFRCTVVAGTVGSVLDETRQTGFLFLVSCQIVAMIGPSPVIFCHCLNSPGLSFSFETTGSPLLGFLFAICPGRSFTFHFTVPQPKSFLLSNSWCKLCRYQFDRLPSPRAPRGFCTEMCAQLQGFCRTENARGPGQ